MNASARTFILLHADDNVLICCRRIEAGEPIWVEGVRLEMTHAIDLGHKLARRPLAIGAKVIKYGAAIGSLTHAVQTGEWIHTHNMRSDYIPAHGRDSRQP